MKGIPSQTSSRWYKKLLLSSNSVRKGGEEVILFVFSATIAANINVIPIAFPMLSVSAVSYDWCYQMQMIIKCWMWNDFFFIYTFVCWWCTSYIKFVGEDEMLLEQKIVFWEFFERLVSNLMIVYLSFSLGGDVGYCITLYRLLLLDMTRNDMARHGAPLKPSNILFFCWLTYFSLA